MKRLALGIGMLRLGRLLAARQSAQTPGAAAVPPTSRPVHQQVAKRVRRGHLRGPEDATIPNPAPSSPSDTATFGSSTEPGLYIQWDLSGLAAALRICYSGL